MNRVLLPMIATTCVATLIQSVSAGLPTFRDETVSRLNTTTIVWQSDGEEKDVAVADFNQDGWDDIIVVRKAPFYQNGGRTHFVLLNINGTLFEKSNLYTPDFLADASNAREVIADDFNRDGYPDVVVINTFGEQPTYYQNLGVSKGNKWNGLKRGGTHGIPQLPQLSPAPTACGAASGDLTGNGVPDLFITSYVAGGPISDYLLVNDGSANFVDETATRIPASPAVYFGTGADIADMDNDGDNDIFRSWVFDMHVLFQSGGTFLTRQDLLNEGPSYMGTAGDLNGDGLGDVYVVSDIQDQVHFGPAYAATFLSNSPRTTGFGGNVHFGDVDGDGDLDVGVGPIDVIAENCPPNPPLGSGVFTLLENDGSGMLSDPNVADQKFHVPAHDFAFIDINNDGKLDLFQALCEGYQVLIQQ